MEKSVIDEAGRVEIEESLDDFPTIKRENEKRIQKIKLSQGVRLSMNGEGRWRGMKDHLELKKVGNYWLPSKGTNLQKRNMLLEAKKDLLAFHKDLPVQDLAIIVKHYLNRSVKFLKKKLKEDTQQKQSTELNEYASVEQQGVSSASEAGWEDTEKNRAGEAAPLDASMTKPDRNRRIRGHHPEIGRIFWRAFIALRERTGLDPEYNTVWNTVYQDFVESEKKKHWKKPEYDPHEFIWQMNSADHPDAKLWWIHQDYESPYLLTSLPSKLSRLKKNPPSLD